MLQITSGRFWGNVDRYELQNTASLYSVLKVGQSTTTKVGTLVPAEAEYSTDIQCTEFTYQHGLPLPLKGTAPGIMVGTGGQEVKEQMLALLTAYTGRLWTQDTESILDLIERNKQSNAYFPYFTAADEVEMDSKELCLFIWQTISLPRVSYRKVSAAAVTLQQVIQASEISYDAAFSMAIFAIESLVPDDEEAPDWSYAPRKLKDEIDKILTSHEEIAEKVRTALLKDRHFKLQAKFIKFIEDKIGEDFYRSPTGIKRLDLRRVLRNAYSGRSKYAHKLVSVERSAFGIHRNQSVSWEKGEPHLTLQGAALLLSEVIRGYIRSGPHSEKEDGVNWKRQLPGLINDVPIAPEYWLWNPKLFERQDLRDLLCHVVRHTTRLMTGAEETRIDIRKGLEVGIARIEQMSKRDRLCFVCIVLLWVWIAPNHKPIGCDVFLSEHENKLDKPSPESLMIYALGGFQIPWSIKDTERQWQTYVQERYGSRKLRFIHPVEAAMQGIIANMFLVSGDIGSYEAYCNHIADSEGDRPYIIKHVGECIEQRSQLSIPLLLGVQPSESKDES